MHERLTDYRFPEDLKSMTTEELELLAVQIREFLIESVAKTGGHLSPNLGVVELTIALHAHYNSPEDKIVFDVGHQSYVHKILTGRADQFDSLRQFGGLSGYPKRGESEHDLFDTGHTSTSVSLMAGLAKARDLKGEHYKTIAVIGDGALSGGLAYEALNNLGAGRTNALVILNDNEMSIGKTELALDSHLSKLRMSKGYTGLKRSASNALERIPKVGGGIREGLATLKDSFKYALLDSAMFEKMGFTYLGPIDGHDIHLLMQYLTMADRCDGPVLLHVSTKKGKGYKPAENNPTTYHGLKPYDPATGVPISYGPKTKGFPDVFGEAMEELAAEDERIVAVSAAMLDGTGLAGFHEKFPERTFDVGIAEGYAVSFAAGLAEGGLKPVVAIYSTFLQRGYDELIIDVCLDKLPVIFAIDRAGNVGEDGETHHGIFDLSYLSPIPGLTILSPRDGTELKEMLRYALTLDGPCAIRYPKTSAEDLDLSRIPLEEGAQVVSEGKDCELWAVGNMSSLAVEIQKKLQERDVDAGLVIPRFVKPLDTEALKASADRTKLVFTLEDNVGTGGFGEQVMVLLKDSDVKVDGLCWPDEFIPQGSVSDLFDAYGFDAATVTERIVAILEG